jgi:hypothetical protein
MKCPHCLENFFEKWEDFDPYTLTDSDGKWQLKYCTCPSCKRIIVYLGKYSARYDCYIFNFVRPKTISRTPLPPEVPPEFANDYKEACLVFADSPKASAALSRRCLQNLLKEKSGTQKKDLADQIQEVLDSKTLPSYLAESLDAVRNIGNFATHPIKSKSTGEIVDVEPGEAEWNLDVLEGLFDFYFVQEQKLREKREKLNQKLKDVGKPPMK